MIVQYQQTLVRTCLAQNNSTTTVGVTRRGIPPCLAWRAQLRHARHRRTALLFSTSCSVTSTGKLPRYMYGSRSIGCLDQRSPSKMYEETLVSRANALWTPEKATVHIRRYPKVHVAGPQRPHVASIFSIIQQREQSRY